MPRFSEPAIGGEPWSGRLAAAAAPRASLGATIPLATSLSTGAGRQRHGGRWFNRAGDAMLRSVFAATAAAR